MPPTVKLHVAIYHSGVYKHWSLFVEGATDSEKIILHAMGSSTRYRFEMRNSNARESKSLAELVYLCDVPAFKVEAIKDTAKNAVIHNEFAGYNCQDYVLELLDDLEAEGIIDGGDATYAANKASVKGKQEGLA
ncbi:hypothetical protein I7I51_07495 [Histoplasma capsulatum]|uniref:Uncharacterized protein n=3 Tax=Ajellomycetaceae TaxID=299071 RepID=A0A179UDJ9_BLAGS|nr:predicted protein [Histoplasma mississippiense (nom. inval.)]XP_031576256.1 uncharacterized protein BDBG_01110 [Blastomyces gilchristii SLH14081]XP_045276014.1 uncharacterized protein BDCG_04116 [Blastomyces dermatitidis ER-3]QSS58073.1 hypothetical protein I7I51_07495 [Histoplasma capsulatum]EDN02499.1 predicted protein [Histoplasma mississippiense (nom. inval.)]EEQ88996.1 hypothetical protein BDCG_04116 [Blastomyces dermatitidis ER-3]OAT04582.1 hypothetical protein BDBG_01110 [Blastomyce